MSKKESDFHNRAIQAVKCLLGMYIANQEPEDFINAVEEFPDNFLTVGTGRHEFYKNKKEFLIGLSADQKEARDVQFELQDEWYEVQEISRDVCVVYGSIWVREKSTPGKSVLIDMEGSRLTVVCLDTVKGVRICSIHHSMPYLDQGEDEYYPKSLASLADEAIKRSKALEYLVELDYMTELYNRVCMEQHVDQAMKGENGYFFCIDLDDFKCVNDSLGHLAGDQTIKAFARLLRKSFADHAIIGRMGGDEFAVWDSTIQDDNTAMKHFQTLIEGCCSLSEKIGISVNCSAGIAFSHPSDEGFTALYKRADQAMYCAKRKGKGCICWAETPASEIPS